MVSPRSARRGAGAPAGRRGDGEAIRITTAGTSARDENLARQRRYLLSMAVRTLCFVGALAVGGGWLRWVLLAGAVFLPYLSVVAANTSSTGDDGFVLPEVEDQSRPLGAGFTSPSASPAASPNRGPRGAPGDTR
ncbi:MAG: DUF3099 domain-containing protein [Nocardioides sp.]